MLILTRKVDQGIIIQGNIVVTVLRVERDRVKLGISAPEEITVLREELLLRDAGARREEDPPNSGGKDAPPATHFRFFDKPGGGRSGGAPSPKPSNGN